MPGVKISDLPSGSPIQRTDIFPVARSGITLGIRASDILDRITKNETDIQTLSGQTITVVDSPTIDLTYNSTTRTLSANLQQTLDLTTRVVHLPCNVETPPGTVTSYLGNIPPCGWLACNGDIVPNTPSGATNTITAPGLNFGKSGNFSRLHSVLGTTYGSTPGTLPDLRGMFIRGWDQGIGIDPQTGGRLFGTTQQDAFQGHKHDIYDPTHDHTGSANEAGEHTHKYDVWTDAGSDLEFGETHDDGMWEEKTTKPAGKHTHTLTVNSNSTGVTVQNPRPDNTAGAGEVLGPGGIPRTASETRPKNVALLWIVKY